jgi:drug/metabolite transporter (DMT)-like permease
VLQTAQMFVGEAGCWLVIGLMAAYSRIANRKNPSNTGYQPVNSNDVDAPADADPNADAASVTSEDTLLPHRKTGTGPRGILSGFGILLLALPAICDILGTTLMNAGLLMVAASIYQMTRGALVLFVGLFSVVFLRRKLHLFQWLSLVGVVTGVALVGLAGAIQPDSKAKATSLTTLVAEDPMAAEAVRVVLGVVLIAGAQVFTATQFVLEEFLLERSSIDPIEVVGWEGLFGLAVTLIGMLVLHFAIGRTDAGRLGPFDVVEGFRQMVDNKIVLISSFLIMISIGYVFIHHQFPNLSYLALSWLTWIRSGFNFFGLSVTRTVSATSRSTIDTCRTLFIWIVSLGLGWETFKWLQVAGFALLVYFTFVFNGIVQPPFAFLRPRQEVEPLLPEEPIEHN